MALYRDPFDELASIIVYAFLLCGWAVSVGIALVMAYTCGTDESLCRLLFWPAVAAVSFSISLFFYIATEPHHLGVGLGPEPLDTPKEK